MKVVGDRLEGVKWVGTDSMGGVIHPEYVVIHYTATANGAGVVKAFQGQGGAKVSAHLVVDTDGSVTQMVPFNRAAWHAGQSEWAGRSGCNQFTIGIEIVNLGYLVKTTDGFRDAYGRPYHGAVVEARHKNPALRFNYWAAYTPEQIEVVSEICSALAETYPLRGIVGHEDIAPARKSDPGPAYPLRKLQALLESRADDSPPLLLATTRLNVRTGAGVNFPVVPGSPLADGASMTQVDTDGNWIHIIAPDGSVEGWVHKNFVVQV